ncbi:hypothetical protein CKO09_06700 [Chromatium weissei]|nr:hypothetical protein [Chromatium weissei]
MNAFWLTLLAFGIAILSIKLWAIQRRAKRAAYIRTYIFPLGLLNRFAAHYPQLNARERHLVTRALRQFFIAYLNSGRQFVSMPSQAADALWHEFILYTRHYQIFCRRAFGRFLHHTPAVVLSANRQNNTGLRRVWWYCCRDEKLNPRCSERLPLLFALDEKIGIENGFYYALDCTEQHSNSSVHVHCVGDFASSDFDGSIDGLGDFFSGDGDGGDGCGGDGCGGD